MVSREEIDSTYKEYHDSVNMTYNELLAWSKHPCSELASLDRSPLYRNLELLRTPKKDWSEKHVAWAKKTISFNSRMQEVPAGEPASSGCPSKRTIALRNWAYNPAGKLPR